MSIYEIAPISNMLHILYILYIKVNVVHIWVFNILYLYILHFLYCICLCEDTSVGGGGSKIRGMGTTDVMDKINNNNNMHCQV